MKRFIMLSGFGKFNSRVFKLLKILLKRIMGESGYLFFRKYYWNLLNLLNLLKIFLKTRTYQRKKNKIIRYSRNDEYDKNKVSFFCTSAIIEEHYHFYVNAFKTWKKLGIDITLFGPYGKEFIEILEKYNIKWCSEKVDNISKIPKLNGLLESCKKHCNSEYMCFINCDIMFSPNFINTFNFLYNNFNDFFMVGQRWDWTNSTAIDIEDSFEKIMRLENREMSIHCPKGIDYFLFRVSSLDNLDIPPFFVPRCRWDHWLAGLSKSLSVPLIDTTLTNLVIHPEPGPEIRMAMKSETVFSQKRFNESLYEQFGGCDISDADYETYYAKNKHIKVRIKRRKFIS